MLNDQDKIKFQTFLNTLQEKCRERESSVEVRCSYNMLRNSWFIVLDYGGEKEEYVTAQDYFWEWIWLSRINE